MFVHAIVQNFKKTFTSTVFLSVEFVISLGMVLLKNMQKSIYACSCKTDFSQI
jgi:hypothetical protein